MSPSLASLTARDLTVAAGPHILLAGVDLTVAPGSRLGLVGPNGSGKSTLLRTLAGEHPAERGTVRRSPGDATVGYLAQEVRPAAGETGHDLLARRTGVAAARMELDRSTAALAAGDTAPNRDRYAAALERWLALGGADLDGRAAAAVEDLGLPAGVLDDPVRHLSGGQAARLQLAALLLARFDVLLLDEPTNNLDLDGLDRLEDFVVGCSGPVVLVAHDRAFLERTVTAVVEIDDRDRASAPPSLARYEGGWQVYLDERARARHHAEEAHEAYVATRRALEDRVDRQQRWSARGVRTAQRSDEPDKFIRRGKVEGAQRTAGRARKARDALERLEPVTKPWEGWDLRLRIAGGERSGDEVVTLTGAVVEHPAAGGRPGFRLGPVDLRVHRGDRVAITGPNGSGKSTLLGAVLGRQSLVSGRWHLGANVVIGEIDQGRDSMGGASTVLEGFMALTGTAGTAARGTLAKFGLGAGHVTRSPASLSPGERTRAALAVLQARGVNTLVLDEPTNHLDLPAIEQLEQAVAGFGGTLLLVTHDRRMLDAARCDRVVEVSGGTVTCFW